MPIDFNTAGHQRAEQLGVDVSPALDPISALLNRMAEYELFPDTINADSQLHRFDIDKNADKCGWYVVHQDNNFLVCSFGNWKADLKEGSWGLSLTTSHGRQES